MADTDIDAALDRIESGQDAGSPPAAAPAADTQPSTPAAPSAPAAATPPDADPFDTGADTFDRKYVEKLRTEAARYRTDAKQLRDEHGRFQSAFDGYDPADRDTLLDLASTLRNDPAAAADWMEQTVRQLRDQHQAAQAAGEKPMTRAEFEKELASREADQQKRQLLDGVYRDIEGLGIKRDSEEATAVMALAASHYGGDVKKAHAQMATWAQSAVDQYVAGKAKDADGPSPTPTSGTVAPAEKKITDVNAGAKAASAYLESLGMK